MPDEQTIRRLVRRLVEQEVAGDSAGRTGESSAPVGTPVPSPSRSASGHTAPAPPAGDPLPTPDDTVIALGADHGGVGMKNELLAFLHEEGYRTLDCGTHGTDSVDYPDFAHAVACKVAAGEATWGLVVDGAGIGSAMVANKVPGVRAALCYDLSSARNSREHNHANVLTLGAGLIGPGLARQILLAWLETPWGPGRHARRAQKISQVEGRYLCTKP